jgi:pimeloyl-ACP methyl ester carboxylesterase
VIMLHGFHNNSDSWFDRGYVDALKDRCRVVVPDMPGRQPSDCPQDVEAFSREALAGYLTSLLDAEGAARGVCWGYSWGGALAYCAAYVAPERFDAWIVGGQPPYLVEEYLGVPRNLADGMEAFIARMEAAGASVPPGRRAELMRLDAVSLVAAAKAIQIYGEQPEALARMTAPSLFYVGSDDPLHDGVKRAAELAPNARFVSFPGLDHRGVPQQVSLVLDQVRLFLNDVTADVGPSRTER